MLLSGAFPTRTILRGLRSLWVAYVVLVGVVGLVGGQHVWSRFDPMMNPCHERAKYPAMCALGQTCYNTGPRKFECMGVAFPWSTTIHSNMKVWFDASDINGNGVADVEEGYVPAGGLVNEWVSRVGGITATAVGSSPSLDASAVGGKPSVHFTGQYLSTVSSLLTLSPDYSVFVAVHDVSQHSGQIMIELSTNSNTLGGFRVDGHDLAGSSITGAISQSSSPLTWFATTYEGLADINKVGSLWSNGIEFVWRTNGVQEIAIGKPPPESISDSLYIGCRSGYAYCFSGYIAEIIIVDGILPLSEVQAVEQYLMSKYSIS